MNIALLAPEFLHAWGGVGIYAVNLACGLSRLPGLKVHVITPRPAKFFATEQVQRAMPRVRIHTISVANDTFLYNFGFQKALLENFGLLHRQIGFDIVHSANLVHMPDIFLRFRRWDVPFVCTAHTTIRGQVAGFLQSNKNPFRMAPSEQWSILLYPAISTLERMYLKRTANLLTVSEKFRRNFQEKHSFARVSCIHNCIDTDVYSCSKTSRSEAEKMFGLRGKAPRILFAGRIITQKGIGVLAQSLRMLKDMGNPFCCVVAGRGDTALLQRLLENNRLSPGDVKYMGYVPNRRLAHLYRACDIFALPSFYENFPISLLEAMSMRCVPVATDVGAVDEIIESSRDGFIVKPGSAEGFAEKLSLLIREPVLRHAMGEIAEQKIARRYSQSEFARKHLQYYRSVLGAAA